jgi:hypothetical protein
VTAFDAKPGAELPLTVAVSYPNGFTETLSIMVLAAEDVQQASGTQSADLLIRDRKVPAIIGTGWLKHYPLAYGYRWRSRTVKKCFILCWTETEYQRNFYVNQGWIGSGNGWIGSGTWFAGQLYAN